MTYQPDLTIKIQSILNQLEKIKKKVEELEVQQAIGELYRLEYEKLIIQIKDIHNGSKD